MGRLTREQVEMMTPEEREAMKAKIQGRISQPQTPQYGGLQVQANPLAGIGRLIAMTGSAFATGKVPEEAFKEGATSLTEPDWYAKKQFEQEQQKEMEKYKAGLKPRGAQLKTVGGNIVSIDRDTGDVETVFEAPPKELTPSQKKAQMDLEDRERQKEIASQTVRDSAQDTLNTISEVEKGLNMATGFGLLGNMPSIPGTPRATWEANVQKLLSGKVISVMNDMKNASKTGATGFGQLSNKELKVLQDASTALKRTLAPGDAQKILEDMKAKLQKIANPSDGEMVNTGTAPDYKSMYGLE